MRCRWGGDSMDDEKGQPGRNSLPLEISEPLREQASRCRKEKCCLEGEGLCEVVESVAEKVFFVEGEGGRTCSYCLSFGNAHYCNCPVRQELYRKYKI